MLSNNFWTSQNNVQNNSLWRVWLQDRFLEIIVKFDGWEQFYKIRKVLVENKKTLAYYQIISKIHLLHNYSFDILWFFRIEISYFLYISVFISNLRPFVLPTSYIIWLNRLAICLSNHYLQLGLTLKALTVIINKVPKTKLIRQREVVFWENYFETVNSGRTFAEI